MTTNMVSSEEINKRAYDVIAAEFGADHAMSVAIWYSGPALPADEVPDVLQTIVAEYSAM